MHRKQQNIMIVVYTKQAIKHSPKKQLTAFTTSRINLNGGFRNNFSVSGGFLTNFPSVS